MKKILAFGLMCLATPLLSAPAITPTSTWHLQLDGKLKHPKRQVYDIDLVETSTAAITSLHAKGRTVICYFSAGSFEEWRPDADQFPQATKGKQLDGWAGEYWLDIRMPEVLDIMRARLDLAVEKGCDGVDPDNVDAYSNDSGFPLTSEDQINYNKAIAAVVTWSTENGEFFILYPKLFQDDKICGFSGIFHQNFGGNAKFFNGFSI